MIGVYFEPGATRIVKAKDRKGMLCVIESETLEAYLRYVREGNVAELAELFSQINKVVGTLYEEFYIVLPDEDFCYVDCQNYSQSTDDDSSRKDWLESQIKMDVSQIYYSFPIGLRSRTRTKKTSYCISKYIVNGLIDAAREADISLVSVEPLSFAYLRALRDWRKEHYILEVFEQEANLIAYSSAGGLFKMSTPQLAWNILKKSPDEIEKSISDALLQCDTIAKKTFEDLNVGIPVHLVGIESCIEPLQEITRRKERFAERKFPDTFIETNFIDEEEISFFAALGTMLQVFDQADGFYGNIPGYLFLSTANVLPASAQVESKMLRMKKITKKYTKIGVCMMTLLLGIQFGSIVYFNSIQIPAKLQDDYDRANQTIDELKKETSVIKKQMQEHQTPLEALEALLLPRPREIEFANIEIGHRGTTGKEKMNEWIRCDIRGSNPMLFRNYTDNLTENKIFKGININQITTESTGIKHASITIGKGSVK